MDNQIEYMFQETFTEIEIFKKQLEKKIPINTSRITHILFAITVVTILLNQAQLLGDTTCLGIMISIITTYLFIPNILIPNHHKRKNLNDFLCDLTNLIATYKIKLARHIDKLKQNNETDVKKSIDNDIYNDLISLTEEFHKIKLEVNKV